MEVFQWNPIYPLEVKKKHINNLYLHAISANNPVIPIHHYPGLKLYLCSFPYESEKTPVGPCFFFVKILPYYL